MRGSGIGSNPSPNSFGYSQNSDNSWSSRTTTNTVSGDSLQLEQSGIFTMEHGRIPFSRTNESIVEWSHEVVPGEDRHAVFDSPLIMNGGFMFQLLLILSEFLVASYAHCYCEEKLDELAKK